MSWSKHHTQATPEMTALKPARGTNWHTTHIACRILMTKAFAIHQPFSAHSVAAIQTSLTCYMRPLKGWPDVEAVQSRKH
eukprot:7067326-Heterocapsa_arctica.AAC.1